MLRVVLKNTEKQNQSADFNIEAKISLENRNRYDWEVTDLSNQRELIELVQQYLHDPLKKESLLPANTGLLSPWIAALIDKYNAILLERDRLMENGGDNSPVVRARNNEVASLRQAVIQSLRNTKNEISSKLEYARRMQMLEAGKISGIPTQQKYVLSVERQRK